MLCNENDKNALTIDWQFVDTIVAEWLERPIKIKVLETFLSHLKFLNTSQGAHNLAEWGESK